MINGFYRFQLFSEIECLIPWFSLLKLRNNLIVFIFLIELIAKSIVFKQKNPHDLINWFVEKL